MRVLCFFCGISVTYDGAVLMGSTSKLFCES